MRILYAYLRQALLLLLAGGLLASPATAGTLAATPSLAGVLNPDGTVKTGASGSFDARQFRLETAPDGRPVFRPAGTAGAGDARWQGGFGLPNGTDGQLLTVVRQGADLYIGGSFTVIGNTAARNVARWNGTAWSSLGSGLNGTANAMALTATGELYVGGKFTQAGGVPARNVARWNGSTWSALGLGVESNIRSELAEVDALALAANGDLYVGGFFDQAGSLTDTNNLARWDGTAWSRLGTLAYNGTNSYVKSLVVAASGDLYVGGQFTRAGNANATRIAKWNGSVWTTLGQGIGSVSTDGVFAMALAPNGDLYAGGSFVQAGGRAANALAKWNGTAWTPFIAFPVTGLGNGVNSYVQALAVAANGDLYVGGLFTQVGRTNTTGVAKWDGAAWSTLGAGVGNGGGSGAYALSLAASGELYAVGLFDRAGALPVENLARWNGVAWTTAPGTAALGLNQQILAVAVASNGDVYVGGLFYRAGGVAANNVAKWNGTMWSALGSGITAAGSAFNLDPAVFSLAIAPNGDLYVGGYFSLVGSLRANNIARWNGSTWSTLGTGNTTNGVSGDGFSLAIVHALAVAPSGDVYVGGNFIAAGGQPANFVARWSGTAWSSLGTGPANGVYGVVSALVVAPSGNLYVGGNITQAGGQPALRVAKWNGAAWSPLGMGLSQSGSPYCTVSALALAPNGDLYAGGDMTIAGTVPVNHVAKWNGTAWSAVGTGVGIAINNGVQALALAATGELYAGGTFGQAGALPVANVARWDGTTWNPLGTGLNRAPTAIAIGPTGLVYMGGVFTTTGDGSKALAYFAIYDPALPLATASPVAAPPSLYPNPAHHTAVLRLPTGTRPQPLALLDAQGRVVRQYPAPAGAEAELDLRGLPAGMYLVRCGPTTQRLLVE
jgi:hypothetical protein